MRIEIKLARAAPATPIFGHGPIPKISNGARITLRITLNI